ncbi:MAG: endopeptidase La [Clostridia bacterium]|nr:endopeptidase La [Clostridia bacterium]
MKREELKFVTLPVIPLRGIVLFPDMTLHFDIGRKSSLAALKAAGEKGSNIFFVTQTDINTENPDIDELYSVGVVGKIRQIVKLPDRGSTVRVVVEGIQRGKIVETVLKRPYIKAEVEYLEDDYSMPEEIAEPKLMAEAALYSVRRYFDDYCMHAPQLTPDIISAVFQQDDISATADMIAGNIMLSMDDKQKLLAELNIFRRLEQLCVMLSHETEILILDEMLQEKVHDQMDKNQREYFLREEMKAITEELNALDGEDSTGLLSRVNASRMPEQLKEKMYTELERLKKLSQGSPDANVLRTYIEKCLEIPWGVYTKENKSLQKAVRVLEKDHYGLKEVKERITEMIAALIVSPDIKGQIICLAGPPGVGKTSIAKSIAAATNRNYTRISLGGVKDEAEIRGHRRTYIGAMPGRIVNALIEAKSQNPLILLDEIDKLSADYKGDPSSALLEVLDGEQNFSFRDHYIELPVDLSKVLFITTANDKHAIPAALRDRMEVIDLAGYTYEEKLHIAKKHLIPKQMKAHALTKENIRFTDSAVRSIIDGYTREAGVRILERKIAAVCRKETVRLANGDNEKLDVTDKNIEQLLGVRKYRPDEKRTTDEIGLVNGLAWTAVGGEMLEVEVAVLEGTGKLELTGSLGDVMKESARAAVTYIRSKYKELGIDGEFYKNKDIHIHFPEGAVPKDGPSAGITVTTALVSALSETPVRGDVAMTGEVTIRGRVLAIGGLREKSMAAYREGMKYVLIPQANVPDLQDVDKAVKDKITFIPVKNVDEVLDFCLIKKEESVFEEEASQPENKTLEIPKHKYQEQRGRTGELQ